MTIRYNAKPTTRFNVAPLPSGYENIAEPALTIPAVGIEDVDRALFNLFDKEIPLSVKTSEGMKKVPIIFAAGEKWALQKRNKALRDKNGALILPLITVVRNSIEQNMANDVTGRGINQQTGEIVIKRRLDTSDRGYQSLINRFLLPNQLNVAIDRSDGTQPGQLQTSREIGDLQHDGVIEDGGLLAPVRNNNIYEIITVPAPQFFTAKYEITIWSQYSLQMTSIIEGLISSFLPQGLSWKLDTDKGYWFIATVEGNMYTSDSNFDDMSQEERVIKHKFNVNVPGYILASSVPGAPVPVRRYVSSPSISFDVSTDVMQDGVDDPFLGADDPTLPLKDAKTRRRDQRDDASTRLYPVLGATTPDDPALTNLKRGSELAKYKKITGVDNKGRQVVRYVRVKNRNKYTGEMTFESSFDLGQITIIAIED